MYLPIGLIVEFLNIAFGKFENYFGDFCAKGRGAFGKCWSLLWNFSNHEKVHQKIPTCDKRGPHLDSTSGYIWKLFVLFFQKKIGRQSHCEIAYSIKALPQLKWIQRLKFFVPDYQPGLELKYVPYSTWPVTATSSHFSNYYAQVGLILSLPLLLIQFILTTWW